MEQIELKHFTMDNMQYLKRKAEDGIKLSERTDIVHSVTVSAYWLKEFIEKIEQLEKEVEWERDGLSTDDIRRMY